MSSHSFFLPYLHLIDDASVFFFLLRNVMDRVQKVRVFSTSREFACLCSGAVLGAQARRSPPKQFWRSLTFDLFFETETKGARFSEKMAGDLYITKKRAIWAFFEQKHEPAQSHLWSLECRWHRLISRCAATLQSTFMIIWSFLLCILNNIMFLLHLRRNAHV